MPGSGVDAQGMAAANAAAAAAAASGNAATGSPGAAGGGFSGWSPKMLELLSGMAYNPGYGLGFTDFYQRYAPKAFQGMQTMMGGGVPQPVAPVAAPVATPKPIAAYPTAGQPTPVYSPNFGGGGAQIQAAQQQLARRFGLGFPVK